MGGFRNDVIAVGVGGLEIWRLEFGLAAERRATM
jgi:hypothetical protein